MVKTKKKGIDCFPNKPQPQLTQNPTYYKVVLSYWVPNSAASKNSAPQISMDFHNKNIPEIYQFKPYFLLHFEDPFYLSFILR